MPSQEEHVWGVLWELDIEHADTLDQQEGVPHVYNKKQVTENIIGNKIGHSSRSSSIQRSKTAADQRCLVMFNNFKKFSFPSIEKKGQKKNREERTRKKRKKEKQIKRRKKSKRK